ncbi:MAG: VWA domain-containing protein [Butyrivibrio sp.]|nr:VWA domain-containing protein [Butyrivibrio sp.]
MMKRRDFFTKRILSVSACIVVLLGALSLCSVKTGATSPEAQASEMAGKAANQAYESAKAAGKDEATAMSEAQKVSEMVYPQALSIFRNSQNQEQAPAANTSEQNNAANEAFYKQTNEAIKQQNQALKDVVSAVEALGREEEEAEKGPIFVAESRTTIENPCVTWYVKGITEKIKSSEAFITSRSIKIEESGILGDGDGPSPKTLILVDNSASVAKYKDKIRTILTRLVWNHQPQEQFSIELFGKEHETLLDYTDNYDDVRMAIDKITYKDQSTQLRNVLYKEIVEMEENGEDNYNRIIVISDGTEDSILGMTYEELADLVSSDTYKCPIYTIGCSYAPAVGKLDKLFGLSRRTNSPYFKIDDYKDVNDIADIIRNDDKNVRYFRFTLPDDLRDGDLKTIGLHLTFEEDEIMISDSIVAPYAPIDVIRQVAEEKAKKEAQEQQEHQALLDQMDDLVEDLQDHEEGVGAQENSGSGGEDDLLEELDTLTLGELILYLFAHNAIWISLGLLIVYFAYISFSGRQKVQRKKLEDDEEAIAAETEILTTDINNAIYLFEPNTPDVKYPVKVGEEKIIGRSRARCDISFPTDRAMSSRQASIRVEGGAEKQAVLENLDPQGGTKVDGEVVTNDIVLRNGARIKMGATLLEVRYE